MEEGTSVNGRRRFLVGTIYGLVSFIGAGFGIPAVLYLFLRPKGQSPGNWVDAGELSSMEPGTPREITFRRNRVDGWKIRSEKQTAWVIKNPDGSLLALSPWCTHLGCAYRWVPMKSQFACPCHGSWFSKTGQVLSGPAPRPLDRYETRVEGNRLWLGPVRKTEVS
jgi:menaquinol-cytochrome c reductase iron-sulfur subunit